MSPAGTVDVAGDSHATDSSVRLPVGRSLVAHTVGRDSVNISVIVSGEISAEPSDVVEWELHENPPTVSPHPTIRCRTHLIRQSSVEPPASSATSAVGYNWRPECNGGPAVRFEVAYSTRSAASGVRTYRSPSSRTSYADVVPSGHSTTTRSTVSFAVPTCINRESCERRSPRALTSR